jgi:precorrin-6x reductase
VRPRRLKKLAAARDLEIEVMKEIAQNAWRACKLAAPPWRLRRPAGCRSAAPCAAINRPARDMKERPI